MAEPDVGELVEAVGAGEGAKVSSEIGQELDDGAGGAVKELEGGGGEEESKGGGGGDVERLEGSELFGV